MGEWTYKPTVEVLDVTTAISTNSQAAVLHPYNGFALDINWTDITPTTFTFVGGDIDTGTNIITEAAHGMLTGCKVQFSTTILLPGGISAATDYFIIYVTSSTFKIATSVANAQAGTAVDITSGGTGTHTCTPTSLSATVKLQGANSDANYKDISGSTVNITGSPSGYLYTVDDVKYRYTKAAITITAGQLTISADMYMTRQ